MNQHIPEKQPQQDQKPWKSRLLPTHRSDERSRREEGRARQRSDTTQQGTNGAVPRRQPNPLQKPQEKPPDHQLLTKALPAAHWEWGQALGRSIRDVRETLEPTGPSAGEHPQQLQREHARVLRTLADAAHHSATGFQDGLKGTDPSPPQGEPHASIYHKAHESGKEAAHALNRRGRRRQRRTAGGNPDGKEQQH